MKTLTAAAFLLLPLPTLGQKATLDCRNPMSQSEMTGCAFRQYRAADAALNVQWKKTLATARKVALQAKSSVDTRADIVSALLSSQRGWIAYRDNHCRSVLLSNGGGSMAPQQEGLCLTGLTRDRTAQLKDLEKRLAW